jgi:peptidoglycan hydrolase CwlO-like protein
MKKLRNTILAITLTATLYTSGCDMGLALLQETKPADQLVEKHIRHPLKQREYARTERKKQEQLQQYQNTPQNTQDLQAQLNRLETQILNPMIKEKQELNKKPNKQYTTLKDLINTYLP